MEDGLETVLARNGVNGDRAAAEADGRERVDDLWCRGERSAAKSDCTRAAMLTQQRGVDVRLGDLAWLVDLRAVAAGSASAMRAETTHAHSPATRSSEPSR